MDRHRKAQSKLPKAKQSVESRDSWNVTRSSLAPPFLWGSGQSTSSSRPSYGGLLGSGADKEHRRESLIPRCKMSVKKRRSASAPRKTCAGSQETLVRGRARSGSQDDLRTPRNLLKPVFTASSGVMKSGACSSNRSPGRKSCGGLENRVALKDTRPLQDKSFQAIATKELQVFLSSHDINMPAKLSSMSKSEFMNIFLFMLSCMKSTFVIRNEEEIPNLLKILGYPNTISKSHCQSAGALHAWPHILGALSWLQGLVEHFMNLEPVHIVPARNPGVVLDNTCLAGIRDYLLEYYIAINTQRRDECREEALVQDFRKNLCEYYQISAEGKDKLEQDIHTLKSQCIDSETKATRKKTLQNKMCDLKKDIVGMEKDIEVRTALLAELKLKPKALDEKIKEADARLVKLTKECDNVKQQVANQSFTEKDAQNLHTNVGEMNSKIDLLKEKVGAYQNKIWNAELENAHNLKASDKAMKQVCQVVFALPQGILTHPTKYECTIEQLVTKETLPQLIEALQEHQTFFTKKIDDVKFEKEKLGLKIKELQETCKNLDKQDWNKELREMQEKEKTIMKEFANKESAQRGKCLTALARVQEKKKELEEMIAIKEDLELKLLNARERLHSIPALYEAKRQEITEGFNKAREKKNLWMDRMNMKEAQGMARCLNLLYEKAEEMMAIINEDK